MQTFLHKRGGGKIIGVAGAIGADCLLDKSSRLEGKSFVSLGSSITQSAIRDSSISASKIEESGILNSQVSGATVQTSILQSVIVRGTGNPDVLGRGNGRRAHVENALLSDGIVIEGCRIRNVEMSGPHLLHTDWDVVPRHHLLRDNSGVRLSLMQCVNDHFQIGCSCKPYSYWDKKEPLLRRYFVDRLGWPVDTFESIRLIFELWRSLPVLASPSWPTILRSA